MTWWQDARARLSRPGARKWYLGTFWGLAYLAIPVIIAWSTGAPALDAVLTTGLVVVIAAVYIVTPPLSWGRPWPIVAVVLLAFLAITCLGFPLVGINAVWFWIYVPIMAAFSWQSRGFTLTSLGVIVLGQLVVISAAGQFEQYWYAAALTLSIGAMMFTFSQQIQTIGRLRDAQAEIARLAVVDERERFARDMHDVLGHSLTVVTVKSELARRLVPIDPSRALAEIADIERLSRGALADLRASVAGYREMSLPAELAAANSALVAAGITPHLPITVDSVDPALRELFAWVLRECVTNVIRHSDAPNCWVVVEPRSLAIRDDGRGGATARDAAGGARGGSGLAGLEARARQAGATLTVRPAEGGGTIVAVRADQVTAVRA
jgi:Signal transduction histidine kinase